MSCEQRAYLRRTGIGTIIDMLLAEVAAQKPDAPFHHIARRLVEVNVAQLRRTLGSATARTRYGRHDVSGARRVAAVAAAAAVADADVVIPTTTVVEDPLSPSQSPSQAAEAAAAAAADAPHGASRRITITQLCRAQMEGAAGEGRRRMLGYKPNLGGPAGSQAKFNQRGYHSKAEQESITARLEAVDSRWTYHDVVTACLRDPASAKLLDRPCFAETIAEPLKLRSVGAPVDVTTLLDEVVSGELAAAGGDGGVVGRLLGATSRAVQSLLSGTEGGEEGRGFLRSSVGVAYLVAMRVSVEVAGLAATGGGGGTCGVDADDHADADADDGRTPAQRLVSSLAKVLAAQPSSETVLARLPLYRHPTVLLFVSARIGGGLPGDDWRHFAREEFSLEAAAAAAAAATAGGGPAAAEDAALFPPRCPLERAFVATASVFLVLWLHAWRLAVSPPTPPPPEQLEALAAFLDAAAAPAAEETLRLRLALLRADGGGGGGERVRRLVASVPPAPVCGLEPVRAVRRAGAGGGLAAVCAWNAEQRARTLLCRRLSTLHAVAAKGMPWGAEGSGGGDAADGGRLAAAQAYWEARAGAHVVAAPYAAVQEAVDAAAGAAAGDGGGEGALRAALRRFLDFFGNGTCVAGQLALLLVGMGDKAADGGRGGAGAEEGFEAALQKAVAGFATVCATHTLVADALCPPHPSQRGGGGTAAPVTLHQHATLPDPPSFALCGGPRTRCGVVLRGGAWCADAAFPPQASLNTVVALYRGDAPPGGDRVFKTAAGAVRDVAQLAAAARCRERRSDDALEAAAELLHGCRPSCGMAEVTRLCRQLLRLGGCTSERLAACLLPTLLAAGEDGGDDAGRDGLRVSHGALLSAAARAWAVLRPALLKDALAARHHTLLALVPAGLQDGVRLGWTLEEYLCRGGTEALAAAAEGSGGQQAYAALLAASLGVAVEEETWARGVGDPPSPLGARSGAGAGAAAAAPRKRRSHRRRSS